MDVYALHPPSRGRTHHARTAPLEGPKAVTCYVVERPYRNRPPPYLIMKPIPFSPGHTEQSPPPSTHPLPPPVHATHLQRRSSLRSTATQTPASPSLFLYIIVFKLSSSLFLSPRWRVGDFYLIQTYSSNTPIRSKHSHFFPAIMTVLEPPSRLFEPYSLFPCNLPKILVLFALYSTLLQKDPPPQELVCLACGPVP